MSDEFDEMRKLMQNKKSINKNKEDETSIKQNKKDTISEGEKECPNCGKINDANAIMCEECNEPLNMSGSSFDNKNKEVEQYKICPNCENQCGMNDTFCNKCGQKLDFETKCPNCGADFSEEDLFCKKCGTKIPKRPQIKSVSKNTCPACGEKYQIGDEFCGNCGYYLKGDDKQSKKEIAETNSKPVINTSENIDNQNKVKCPYCHNYIERYTKKCPHCGEWLSGVSHFGCGSLMMAITTILAIFMAIGGEGIGIPFIGEIGGIWLVVVAFLYFLPSLISDWRGHDSKLAIFIVNLLFGWTFIGWFIALIFAFTGRSR